MSDQNPQRPKVVIGYHADCTDGYTAAWVAYRHYMNDPNKPDVIPRPLYYNKPLPVELEMCKEEDEVVFVDFCPSEDQLEDLLDRGMRVTLIDHHPKAFETYARFQNRHNFSGLVSKDASGAKLTYQYYNPLSPGVPELIEAVSARDLWQHTPEQEALATGYRASFNSFLDLLMLLPVSVDSLFTSGPLMSKFRDMGFILLKEHRRLAQAIINTTQRMMSIHGTRVPVVQLPTALSSAGLAMLYEQPCYRKTFVASYQDTRTSRIWSLRSHADGMDVNEVAKHFGGGGHVHAAGFTVPRKHPLARN